MAISWILNQFKGNKSCISDAILSKLSEHNNVKTYSNSCITEACLAKLNMHQRLIVIDIYYKFHEIPVCGYFVMAYFTDFTSVEGQ